MKLYKVYNGYIGESAVRVYVIAPDEETAMDIAEAQYEADAIQKKKPCDYHDRARMQAELLCDDTSQQWANMPSDG